MAKEIAKKMVDHWAASGGRKFIKGEYFPPGYINRSMGNGSSSGSNGSSSSSSGNGNSRLAITNGDNSENKYVPSSQPTPALLAIKMEAATESVPEKHRDTPPDASTLSSALISNSLSSINPPPVPSLDNYSVSSVSSTPVSTYVKDTYVNSEIGNGLINGGQVEEISNTNAYNGTEAGEEIDQVGVEQFEECAENEDDQEDDDSIL